MSGLNGRSEGPDHLPSWFDRPTSRDTTQPTLFPEDLHDALARLQISTDELDRWHQDGWLSFDSRFDQKLEPHHINELVIVRDAVRSGLPAAYQRKLLMMLPKPLNVDPNKLAFSFAHGWVVPAFTDEPQLEEYMEENLDRWLSGLVEDESTDRLVQIKEQIEALLALNSSQERGASEA